MPPDILDRFLSQLRSKRSARTVKTYGSVLTLFLAYLQAQQCVHPSAADIEAFLARRGRKISASFRNVELAALRAFGSFAVRELIWQKNSATEVTFERVPATTPTVLAEPELHQVFFAANALDGVRSVRALALLAVLSQAGLRVHEAVALNMEQVSLETENLLSVRGKGGTCHNLPLSQPACLLLRAWMAVRDDLAAPDEQALFVLRGGKRMSVRSVQRLVGQLGQTANLSAPISPHALRHTCATLALLNGIDLATVAQFLRHSRVETTLKYLHAIDTRRREMACRVSRGVPVGVLAPAKPVDAQNGFAAEMWLNQAALPSPPCSRSA